MKKSSEGNFEHFPNLSKEDAIAQVKEGADLAGLSRELKADREVVLAAILAEQDGGQSLHYASPELRDDKEVVLVAVKAGGNSVVYASERLRSDKEIGLIAVKGKNQNAYYSLTPELRGDKDIKKAAGIK